jgi:hypothetical protein
VDLDGLLLYHGTSRGEVEATLAATLGCDATDVLFVGGSAVEAWATGLSDLDVYLVSERGVPERSDPVVLHGSLIAHVAVVAPARLEEQLRGLAALPADAQRDPRDSLRLRLDELVLLHRLRTGVALAGAEGLARLRQRVERRRLARVLVDRATAVIPAQAADVGGLLRSGELDSAAVCAQRLLGSAIDAFTAAAGNTNPAEKWRLRKLQEVAARLPEQVPDALAPLTAYGPARDLFLRGPVGECGVDGYAHACAAIARHVVPWAQERFGLASAVEKGAVEKGAVPASAGSAPNADAMAVRLPRLRPEVTARWRFGELVVGTLGAGSEIGITPLTLEALVHFDGVTTIEVAASALAARTTAGKAVLAGSLADLRSVVLALDLAESDVSVAEPQLPSEEVMV